MRKIMLLFLLFIFFYYSNCFSQDDSWWETIKSYEEKLNKMIEDLEKEYQRAEYLEKTKRKREIEEKKVSGEYQKKAIEEVVKFLKDEVGNSQGADFIKKKFESGTIVFGDEDSYFMGKITIDKAHLLNVFDKDLKANFHNLVKFTATVLHECIHSGQWGAYFGMTSNANEEEAYFGTLSAIALWIEQMEKKLQANKKDKPCTGLDLANKLNDIISVLKYYDSTIYEKSNEKMEEKKKLKEEESLKLQMLYEKKAKAENYLKKLELYHKFTEDGLKKIDLKEKEKNALLANIQKIRKANNAYKKNLEEINLEIKKKEELIKLYETQLNEPMLDITKFKWTSQNGSSYNRDKLLKLAEEKQKKVSQEIEKLNEDCQEEKKKIPQVPDYAKNISPPSTTNSKIKLYGCLCKCGLTTGVWGGYYPDPIPNSSPACEKSGFCAGGNWGCFRFYPPTEGSCFESCIKTYSMDLKEIKNEINKIMEDDYNKLIKKAREIMEEYLKSSPEIIFKSNLIKTQLFALKTQNYLSDAKLMYDISQTKKTNPYLALVKEKNKRGDPDIALNSIKEAETIFPAKKNSGETQNIRAEFAIILAKATLNIITDLEFEEGIYMLKKALEIYGEKINNQLTVEIKELLKSVEKWKASWNIIKNEVPKCLEMIKEKNVCICDENYQTKISPAFNSLMIYVYPSSDKWKISNASGRPRAISERDKLEIEIKETLKNAKVECENNKILNTKEMKILKEYYTYKKLQSSQYIDKKELEKNSKNVICGVNALAYAEKILSSNNLCDCQKNELKDIIEIAKKDGKPMSIEFIATPNEIKFGERAEIKLNIRDGRPPFEYEMLGSYKIDKTKSQARGFNVKWLPEKVGKNTFVVSVKDSCGEFIKKEISIYVKSKEEEKEKATPELVKKEKVVSEEKKEKTITKIEVKEEKKTTKIITEEKKEQEKIEKISDSTLKEKEAQKQKEVDLSGNWIANCGDKPINARINQSGSLIELILEDSFYSGNINNSLINLKSKDNSEKITGNVVNSNKINIKVVDKDYPDYPGTCTLERVGKIKDKSEDIKSLKANEVMAVLENKSQNNVHIFIEGQDNFGPHNRLIPNEKRNLKFNPPAEGGFVRFIAGRNGQKIAECKWEYDPSSKPRFPYVIFDETNPFNKLTCKTGLK